MNAPYPIPEDEEKRLEALEKYDLDQLIDKEEFTALTRLASQICNMPMALINFVESERMWSLAGYGTELQDTHRNQSACQYTVMKDEPHEINDLRQHPVLKDHPAVKDEPRLRYYAGIPLKVLDNHNIGTLCVYDDEVNKLEAWQFESLKILADEIVARLNLRVTQKELQELNAHKDKILNIVGHDMRNPLSGIIGIANLVKNNGVDDEQELASMMKLIEESARHLLQNVNDLLDVLYIESGSMRLDPSLIDIEQATCDTVDLHRAAAKLKNIELKTALDITKDMGPYDEIQYEQILGNLITNAIKFTPQGGKVIVRVQYPVQPEAENQTGLKVQVQDNGIGIPEEYMDILFTKYGKHGREGTAGEKSIGLGLSLLKKLVDAHSGHIDVESEEGVETTFTVYLPELEA